MVPHFLWLPSQILFASGTGVTAYYAQQFFSGLEFRRKQLFELPDIEVVALPCATDRAALLNELDHLEKRVNCTIFKDPRKELLSVLDSPSPSTFGQVQLEYYTLWELLQNQTQIPFDLLYAPRAWEVILFHATQKSLPNVFQSEKHQLFNLLSNWEPNYNILYYHCGGLEGNPSLLKRYQRRKGILTDLRP